MADSIEMERRGVPSAVVALEKLALTVGVGMARAQGVPDYPIATVSADLDPSRTVDQAYGSEIEQGQVQELAQTIANIWLHATLPDRASGD